MNCEAPRSGDCVALEIPGRTLSNIDLLYYAELLEIPYFKGVYMRDQLPRPTSNEFPECGVMNFNTSKQAGVHWTCWYRDNAGRRFYFDSFGLNVPTELLKYLKSEEEYISKREVIRRNDVVVQHINTTECGRLCLFVLDCLSQRVPYDEILQTLKLRYDEQTKTE